MIAGKNILLTGAGGGIGTTIARELASAGANLMLVDMNESQLARIRHEIDSGQSRVTTLVMDLGDPEQRSQISRLISEEYDKLDVLINCAGINSFNLFEMTEDIVIEAMIRVNVTVPLCLTRQCLPLLRKSVAPHIINFGSTFGSIGYPGFVTYSTTKFAVRGFSEALRRELSDTTIKVSYIAPRATRTSINTGPVYEMNDALGVKMDAPEVVACEVMKIITRGKGVNRYMGWPEKVFVRINNLFPGLVDGSLRKQLDTIRQYAGLSHT